LVVSPKVLVPRPDTEILVESVLEIHANLPAGNIIELGTGSGAIALALAQEINDREIIAIERSTEALQIATINIAHHGLGKVQLVQSSWLDALRDNSAAIIISNPPYLAADDEHLPALSHEPLSALVSGPSGLEDFEKIIAAGKYTGISGGVMMVEHGHQQASDVRGIFADYNYHRIGTHHDLANRERISYGYF